MIGDKINQLKRNSISAASSPALPLVSTFMVPFAHHFDHKPISHMNRNASSTELSSPGLSSSDSDSREFEVLAKEEEEDDDSGVGVGVVVGDDGDDNLPGQQRRRKGMRSGMSDKSISVSTKY
ncbi:hypothetical protein BY996DRAFT_6417720 [Phakopsora pachyrhizi]|nr:hypothetical protein BY996DRAFT_6417720 [Phakopsora pachyrhizi]